MTDSSMSNLAFKRARGGGGVLAFLLSNHNN